MSQLCFATFFNEFMKYHKGSYLEVSDVLLKPIIENINVKKTIIADINKTSISNFVNMKRDLPGILITGIKKKSSKDILLRELKEAIDIIDDELALNDLIHNLKLLVTNDGNISEKNKTTITTSFDDLEFLANLFIYSCTLDNIPRFDETSDEENLLVRKQKNICPICGEELLHNIKGSLTKSYDLTYIFPKDLELSLEIDFNVIKTKPDNMESLDNKLILCKGCNLKYNKTQNIDTYKKLVESKELLNRSENLDSKLSMIDMDEKISILLDKLKDFTEFENIPLRIDPTTVSNKIQDNIILENTIKDYVSHYFYFIQERISYYEGEGFIKVDNLASSIKKCYLEISKVEKVQSTVFFAISDWLRKKLKLDSTHRTASDIVVAYFVQNCEVFDEISK